ncbi:MAG TPA: hypothetical protein VD905_15240 [Flavobacteriales bacterium]|nr:hypothetical protein [Flavobacteriales bacterium]
MRGFILVTAMLFGTRTHAQQTDTSLVNNVIAGLMQFWNGYTPTQFVQNDSAGIRDVRKFLNEPAFIANKGAKNLDGIIEENNLRAQILRKDWGLKFTTGYLENFNPAFNDDDNLLYNRRLQAGLNWDILNSGLVENRTMAKVQELENLILQSGMLKGNKTEDLTVKWNQVIYLFNLQKIRILEERLKLVKKQNEAAQLLFLSRYLTKEIYLENEKRLAEIQSMLNVYQEFNAQIESLGIKPPHEIDFPLVDLRYETIFADPSHSDATVNDSLMRLIREKNTLKNKYTNDLSIGAFTRYNYYNLITSNPATRSFMSAGVNLSIPINFSNKLRQQYIAQKSLNEYAALTSETDLQQENMLDDAYEYRYKLKQYVVFYQKKLVFNELLRKENARKSIDPVSFNPYKVISLQDDILAIDIELVELKQNMYLKLLRMYARKNNLGQSNAFHAFILPDKIEYVNPIKRSVYAWSSAFTTYDTAFLAEYVKFHDIKSFAVSQGNDKSLAPKIRHTVRSLKKAGVEIELLIGDNNFVTKKIEAYVNDVIDINDLTAVHIDYEPHTFSDWDAKKANYLSNYITVLKKTKEYCKEKYLKLHIDIPLHYDQKAVAEMIEICDNVCFMAYENVKSTYIRDKVASYENKSKLSIALRTNDFPNRAALEEKISELSQLTGITNFYIHDLTRIIAWDERAVEKE